MPVPDLHLRSATIAAVGLMMSVSIAGPVAAQPSGDSGALAVEAPENEETSIEAINAGSVDPANEGVRDEAFFGRLGAYVGVFSDAPERSTLSPSFGYEGQVGWRTGGLGLFATVGHSLWTSVTLNRQIEMGVINAGLGVEYTFFDGHVRSALAGGSSTLLFDAAFDDTGTTGYFVELRPAGVRIALADWAVAELQPLSVNMMRPVTGTPDLTQVVYQSVLSFEVQ